MVVANFSGDWYWVVLAIVVLFGGSQLPKLARNAGDAMREFRKAHTETAAQGQAPHQQPPFQPQAPAGLPSASATGSGGPAQAIPVAAPAAPQQDDRVTLSRAELDALLADREAKARASQQGAQQ